MSSPATESVTGRIALVSLGCAKNLVDSERLMGDLETAGFELADDLGEADIALVNTCGFIDPAKEESIDTILKLTAHKEYGRLRGLMVAGCLVERYLDDLQRDSKIGMTLVFPFAKRQAIKATYAYGSVNDSDESFDIFSLSYQRAF